MRGALVAIALAASATVSPTQAVGSRGILFENDGVWAMNSMGRNQERVTSGAATYDSASWSPGRLLLVVSRYQAEQRNYDLFVLQPSGEIVKRLTRTAASERDAVWAPGGRWVAFERNGKVFLIDPDGSRLRRITPRDVTESDPAWAPGGKRLAIVSDRRRSGDPMMFIVDRSGRTEKVVTDLGSAADIDWSRAGWLAYSYGGNRSGVLVLRPSGKHRHRVGRRSDSRPVWSPDGDHLLVWNQPSGVWKMQKDGSGRVKLADGMPLDWNH